MFPHPSLLQPPLPTTPTPVPREPSRKPLPVSPSTDGLRCPSPPPRSCVPAPRPSAPDLSPTWVSAFLLHPLSCCGEAELSLCSEARARSDPCPCWGSSCSYTVLLSQTPSAPPFHAPACPICNVCTMQTSAATTGYQFRDSRLNSPGEPFGAWVGHIFTSSPLSQPG